MMSKIKREDTRDLNMNQNMNMKCQGVSKRGKPCQNYFHAGWKEFPEHYTCWLHRDQENCKEE